MSEKELTSLVSELARSLRIETPAKRRDGSYRLRFDGRHNVTLSNVPGGQILLSSRLRRLPADTDTKTSMLRNSMQFALGRAASSQSCLSLDKQTDTLFIHQLIEGNTRPMDFEEIVGDFVNDLFWWKDNLAAAPSAPSARKQANVTAQPQFIQPNLLVR
ncbi:CesT family type III secretion system chaperone [Thalassospira sp.]|uniref:CesT family type III secretion system chaperone n=1 Tax=Thalassospira sp. TaxID=1912094 RepID=UPI000C38E81B|nr:CesT family type III secretion system chaperone [Thalassospira sp.]MBC05435.1 hypothetical protein [Thalassospira sp.]|tara:strand:+ start:10686 stop:11165 length:480 start_codon:yes stop_codon:yes gene_type:complete